MENKELHKKYGLLSNMNYVLKAMKEYSPYMFFLLVLGIVSQTVNTYIFPFLIKNVLNVITEEKSIYELIKLCTVFFICLFAASAGRDIFYNKYYTEVIKIRLKLILRKIMKTMTMDFQKIEDPKILDCLEKAERAVNDNSAGIEGLIREMTDFFINLGTTIAGLMILATINRWLVLLMCILAVINFLTINFVNKYTKVHIWDNLSPVFRKLYYMNWNLRNFDYAKDIRMFNLKDWLLNRLKNLYSIRLKAQKDNQRIWFWIGIIQMLIWIVFSFIVYAYLFNQIINKRISIAEFSLYISSAVNLFYTISSLFERLSSMFARSREIDDFRYFMDIKNENALSEKIIPQFDKYEFEFKNVSFKYPGSDQFALKDVNLKIKAGERLAVVGLNGAGKSTFVKLIMRLYEPTKGQILLNGTDVREWDRQSYFSIFAPVFQDVNLFAFTLSENVSMQENENADAERVIDCVEKAGLKQKLESMEKGINTQIRKIIYDDGVDLSGGEQQKLALARALYKNCPVVILDEPTAALDAIAESKLYKDFDDLIGGKTSVYISHRLSSTQFCNNVAMFKDGSLVEYGTHESLMQLNGEYSRMFELQSKYYMENQEEKGM